jgi:hypothetical protein
MVIYYTFVSILFIFLKTIKKLTVNNNKVDDNYTFKWILQSYNQ